MLKKVDEEDKQCGAQIEAQRAQFHTNYIVKIQNEHNEVNIMY